MACSLALVTAACLKKDIAAVFGRAYFKRFKFIEDGRRAFEFRDESALGLSTTMLLAKSGLLLQVALKGLTCYKHAPPISMYNMCLPNLHVGQSWGKALRL